MTFKVGDILKYRNLEIPGANGTICIVVKTRGDNIIVRSHPLYSHWNSHTETHFPNTDRFLELIR